jgi:hypothetical protein
MMSNCLLCGGSSELSLYPTSTIVDLVTQRYARGPLVYPAAVGWSLPTMCSCRLCFHQLKRSGRKGGKKRQPLPMDATLLQTIVPGHMRQQDSRTRERMCLALRTPGNSYSRSFEAIRALLVEQPHLTHSRWWEHNLRTEFFSHKATAKLLRKSGV